MVDSLFLVSHKTKRDVSRIANDVHRIESRRQANVMVASIDATYIVDRRPTLLRFTLKINDTRRMSWSSQLSNRRQALNNDGSSLIRNSLRISNYICVCVCCSVLCSTDVSDDDR